MSFVSEMSETEHIHINTHTHTQVYTHKISFNRSQSAYEVVLSAIIPVYNPNWLSVSVGVSESSESDHASSIEMKKSGPESR